MHDRPPSAVGDPYGLTGSPADQRRIVIFGDVDASAAVIDGTVYAAIDKVRSADLVLYAHAPVVADIDFTAEVVIGQGDLDQGRIFTGNVVEAVPDGDVLRVVCSASPGVHEPLALEFAAKTDALDTLYALLREAGLRDDRLHLQGLDELPVEIFEVIAPIDGLVVTDRVTVAGTVFVPAGAVQGITALLNPHPIIDDFQSRRAYAVTYVTAARLFNAEMEGVRQIDTAVAWANVRLRFANGVTPDDRVVGWNRRQLRQLAARSDLVAVRGVSTSRSWVRRAASRPLADLTMASGGGPTAVAALMTPGTGLREATVAAARAISSPDPLTRITAVSECLEFYAGSTKFSYKFTKADRRKLKKAAKGLSRDKLERVEQLLGQLNQAPLFARLRFRLAQDGVPLTESDIDTLKRVRQHRNELVHGQHDIVNEADVERAVALLARILMYASKAEVIRRQAR